MNDLSIVSLFFGGSCLINAVPHLVSGVTGRPFPTIFAKPIGVGLSSPVINLIWGSANLFFAYMLLCRFAEFEIQNPIDATSVGIGALVMGLGLARHFGHLETSQEVSRIDRA